ncbi:MAG TPA: ABC transporter permease [Permianibacter sp.]|nr:ABC transporter permease [Permianibacter sp.]
MFRYYLQLALKSLKRNPVLSALMVMAIAIGIGACMTTLTVYSLMAADPIPQKSDRLYAVRLDSWDPNQPWAEPNEPPPELTYRDAMALMRSDIPTAHAAMYKGAFALQPDDKSIPAYLVFARITFKDFFSLFDVPFQYGNGWDSSADTSLSQVVVLGKAANDRLFGGADSVGKTVRLNDKAFKVIGVLADWNPTPKFYDVNNGAFNDAEDIYLPFGVALPLQVRTAGNTNGWKPENIDTIESFLNSELVWIQFWAQLDGSDTESPAEQKARYQSFLDSYVMEQKKLGRFERPLNNRLSDVNQFMSEREVVGEDNRVLVGLSFLFLAVCLINMIGLLLAKFLGRAPELALRRALGASQWQVLQLNLVEVSLIGVIGGLLGLLFAWFGLIAVRALYGDGYGALTSLNGTLAAQALLIAITASILAGLYPALRVGRMAPAGLLKTQ